MWHITLNPISNFYTLCQYLKPYLKLLHINPYLKLLHKAHLYCRIPHFLKSRRFVHPFTLVLKHHRLRSSVMFWRVSVGNAHARHSDAKTIITIPLYSLSFFLSVFPYVILCFFLLLPSFMLFFVFHYFFFLHFITLSLILFFVFIIISLSLSVFSYVILCFFLLSLSLSVFPHVILCFFLPKMKIQLNPH